MMTEYINTDTGETVSTLPDDVQGYGDTFPWKHIEDVSIKDLCILVGKLRADLGSHLSPYRGGHYTYVEDD